MVSKVQVYDSSTGEDRLVGTAWFSLRRNALSTVFAYDGDYLSSPDAYAVDPAFPLSARSYHCDGMPGAFRDSSPDRWGRRLIEKSFQEQSRAEGRSARSLDEVDYLLGVFDETREGSLRFCEPGGSFAAQSASIPPIVKLPELLDASRQVAREEAGLPQIKELLEAGSGSLGGARPKASVLDGRRLLLAKFSHPNDRWDVMAWEKTMLDLAASAGISVPKSELVHIGNESVLLLERFDRGGSLLGGRRTGYMSAMTLLGSHDGEQRDYAELAEAAAMLVGNAREQLSELFRRVVFSVAVGNVDDHLRNWAFLRKSGKWETSPMFDVNPTPYENEARAMAILGKVGLRAPQALRELASYADLDETEAVRIVGDVLSATRNWRRAAKRNRCSAQEEQLFAPAFERNRAALREAFGLGSRGGV